ncbi:MAG: exodeoxyribonuclease VII small subunit [Nitrospirae bacterium]|nr:exodeoxyribonuclease VII small subunit [Nitrospirota bacterium]
MAEQKFEAGMKRLEEIVAKMEAGDLPLDDSLKLFEEGIKLSRTLNKTLETAERKVEMLVRGADGGLGTVPFDEGEE